jgi:tryptophan halogenase
MINRIIVLGAGSAGFLAGITLALKLPGVKVRIIRSKDIGIIGVGEGTTVSVPNYIHGFLGIDAVEFHRVAKPTFKLGIKFLWGPRPYFNYTFSPQFDMRYMALSKPTGFYCRGDHDCDHAAINSALMSHDKAFVRLPNGAPGIRNDFAYHIENADFVTCLEKYAARAGAEVVDDTVDGVEQDESGIVALTCRATGRHDADLYVDCSGFFSMLLGKTLREPFTSFKSSLFCDRAVVGGWARAADEPILPYTTAETMDAGWCWRIEHEQRVNRGYVYSSAFISDADADAEFRRKNPRVDATRVVKFISGCYERTWVKNVVAVGNSSGFVEPLESTSLAVICDECYSLALSILDSEREPGPAMAAVFNKATADTWRSIRQFLAIHYKFNTRLETDFWRAARAETDLAGAQDFVDYYRENGPSALWKGTLIRGRDVFGYEGWLAMMVGQQVPYRARFAPPDAEQQTWKAIQDTHHREATAGLSVRETLDVIRSPRWKASPGFFRYPYN